MDDQIVTHYTASAQPHYLLAGMPTLKRADGKVIGLPATAKRNGWCRAYSCYQQCAGEAARVILDW